MNEVIFGERVGVYCAVWFEHFAVEQVVEVEAGDLGVRQDHHDDIGIDPESRKIIFLEEASEVVVRIDRPDPGLTPDLCEGVARDLGTQTGGNHHQENKDKSFHDGTYSKKG